MAKKKESKSLEEVANNTAEIVSAILNIYDGHGVLQGTPEETITSAQGAIMFQNKGLFVPFNHEESATNARDALVGNINTLYSYVSDAAQWDKMCSGRLAKIAAAITPMGFEYQRTLSDTLKYAAELKNNPKYASRLDRAMFVAGERCRENLVSVQIERGPARHIFLERKEKPSIYPVLDDRTIALDKAIKRMPVNQSEQSARNGPLLNFLDKEIHSSSGMNTGAPTMMVFHDAFRKNLKV